jgi:hypothetical protein
MVIMEWHLTPLVVVYETIGWKVRTKLLMSSGVRRLGSACLVTIRK